MTNDTKPRLFGTDGVRGEANTWPMTPEVILKLAMATAPQFLRGDHRHTVVIGKDTRLSGYMVESALTAGFVAMGMDVVLLGPIPTPAVAMLTRSLRADLGVMISASHNPYKDNGIKFFGPNGFKLTNAQEDTIEATLTAENFVLPAAEYAAKARRLDDAGGRYIEFIKGTFPKNLRLDGLKIVVDCAHGAAYKVAPKILWELGAEVIAIGSTPDGQNINDGFGATKPKALQDAVIANGADLGIALDGDADRLILVDETGAVMDGDLLLALIATSWKEEGRLRGNAIVATVMSNLGLERYLENQDMKLIRTNVGDRYVVEAMSASGLNVGGEQSGHLILTDYNSTGDGLVAALQVIAILLGKRQPASYIKTIFNKVPQILKNVGITRRSSIEGQAVKVAIEEAEKEISAVRGRLLVRPSGTEPLIRVMAEGDDEAIVSQIVDRLITTIQQADTRAA